MLAKEDLRQRAAQQGMPQGVPQPRDEMIVNPISPTEEALVKAAAASQQGMPQDMAQGGEPQRGKASAGRQQFVKELLQDFLFSFGRAMAAQAEGKSPMAAGIMAPFELDQLRRQGQQESMQTQYLQQQIETSRTAQARFKSETEAAEEAQLWNRVGGIRDFYESEPGWQKGMIPSELEGGLGVRGDIMRAVGKPVGVPFHPSLPEFGGAGGYAPAEGVAQFDQPLQTGPRSPINVPLSPELAELVGKESMTIQPTGGLKYAQHAAREMEYGKASGKAAGELPASLAFLQAQLEGNPIIAPPGTDIEDVPERFQSRVIRSMPSFEQMAMLAFQRGNMDLFNQVLAAKREYDNVDPEMRLAELNERIARTALTKLTADQKQRLDAMMEGVPLEVATAINQESSRYFREMKIQSTLTSAQNARTVLTASNQALQDWATLIAVVRIFDPNYLVSEADSKLVTTSTNPRVLEAMRVINSYLIGGILSETGRRAIRQLAAEEIARQIIDFDDRSSDFVQRANKVMPMITTDMIESDPFSDDLRSNPFVIQEIKFILEDQRRD
jgi:hypothetical protein